MLENGWRLTVIGIVMHLRTHDTFERDAFWAREFVK
jgi:hypothetical protein